MTPEIHITNLAELPFTFQIVQAGQVRSWRVFDSLNQQLDAGEYEYRVLGPLFARSGNPDMAGILRCRRQHSYEVTLSEGIGNQTSYEDLGDRN